MDNTNEFYILYLKNNNNGSYLESLTPCEEYPRAYYPLESNDTPSNKMTEDDPDSVMFALNRDQKIERM